MKLDRINYSYNLANNKFDEFSYIFDFLITPNGETRTKFLSLFETLEAIFDRELLGPDVVKEREGELTNSHMQFGYRYRSASIEARCSQKVNTTFGANMTYSTEVGETQVPIGGIEFFTVPTFQLVKSLKLNVRHQEINEARTLRIYDSITGINGIEITPLAKAIMERITFLRSGANKMGEIRLERLLP